MNKYLQDLTHELRKVTSIMRNLPSEVQVDEAISLAKFYNDYGNIQTLISKSEGYIREDVAVFTDDVQILQAAVWEYNNLSREEWIECSVSDVITWHLDNLKRAYQQKSREADTLEQLYLSRTDCDVFDDVNTLIDMHVKAQLESQSLYDTWQNNREMLLPTKDFKFYNIEVFINRLHESLRGIQRDLKRIEKDGSTLELLTTQNPILVEGAKQKDFVPAKIALELYPVCVKHHVFGESSPTESDFLCYLNLKPTHGDVTLGYRRKNHFGLLVWWLSKLFSEQKERSAWTHAILEQAGVDYGYWNGHIYTYRYSNPKDGYIDAVNEIIKDLCPEIWDKQGA